eukprot:4569601-Amphidinium_carterae.5
MYALRKQQRADDLAVRVAHLLESPHSKCGGLFPFTWSGPSRRWQALEKKRAESWLIDVKNVGELPLGWADWLHKANHEQAAMQAHVGTGYSCFEHPKNSVARACNYGESCLPHQFYSLNPVLFFIIIAPLMHLNDHTVSGPAHRTQQLMATFSDFASTT